MLNITRWPLGRINICISIILFGVYLPAYSVEFNTDILDAEDRDNIDLARFAEAGYIIPGDYTLGLMVNDHNIKDVDISFFERPQKIYEENSHPPVEACVTRQLLPFLGLKPDVEEKVIWWHEGTCADFSELPGIDVQGDISAATLKISVPQAWLEYQDANWLPPSRWEDGVTGALVDYNVNSTFTRSRSGEQSQNVSGTGVVGANFGPWRLRGDWQSNYNRTAGSQRSTQNSFDWSRIYAYRSLRDISAKLTIGEDYLISDLFDSWRYTGLSVVSDDRMLPPRLRGYAPEVTGIAKTNAKVIISQQGRVIYQTTVASGPFRIQDLSDSVNGQLDVKVEEQDGSVQTFQIDTATIPYLTRPGQVRYKASAGRPSTYAHHIEGPAFGQGEVSWGVTNAWSLYGGGIFADHYNAFAIGIGRDLWELGALSADITQSVAQFPNEGTRQGKSWRLSYSKRFDEINSEVTFAGYRFSEKNYMSMGEYLDARYYGGTINHDKELYTITANKNFVDTRLSLFLNWSHQTYWDRDASDRYSLSLSSYFDLGNWKNMSATVSAARSEYNGRKDDAGYLNISVPFGSGTISYNGVIANDSYAQTTGWYQRLNNGDSYRLQAGTRNGRNDSMSTQASAYYMHNGDTADLTTTISWVQDSYSSAGIALSGGMTASTEGAALHPGGIRGGTRMMVSTDGVSGVPVEKYEHTNRYGIAVVPDISSYYRVTTSLDVNNLPDDIETSGSAISEAVLTEGAIGFRRFEVIKGEKIIAVINLNDGSHPPFGASVRNAQNKELGIVSEGGLTWISGINPNETLSVNWGSSSSCKIQIPEMIPQGQLLLPCVQKPE